MRSRVDIRHQLFAKEFFVDLDAQAAARRAGYKPRSPAALRTIASRLLTNVNVQRYLAEEFARLQARLDLQQDRAVLETMRVAYSNMRQVCHWGPEGVTLVDADALPEDVRATVRTLRCVTTTRRWGGATPGQETTTRVEVALHPKLPALQQLQTYFLRGIPLDQEAEAQIQRLVALTVKYVPRDQVEAYCREVQEQLGITLEPPP
jgi:hypothetical protein